jgi:hypothetical protein
VVLQNDTTSLLPGDAVLEGDQVRWAIPTSARPGVYRVAMEVVGPDGTVLSTNHTDVSVR